MTTRRPLVKRIATGLLTPVRFSIVTGHFRSSLEGLPRDRRGQPVPWYTYPAIDFLSELDFSADRVLEFGAGNSTLWWSQRAEQVVSMEEHALWHRSVLDQLAGRSNVQLELHEDLSAHAQAPLGRQFEVVVIDGGQRFECAKTAVEVVTGDNLIILDDSAGYWGEAGTYPILELLDQKGYRRVDFHGYAPGVITPRCTSIFFLPQTSRLSSLPAPARRSL